jgi:hypothetical protein
MVLAVMARYFPAPGAPDLYTNDATSYVRVAAAAVYDSLVPAELQTQLERTGRAPAAGDVKYIFNTRSGPGPIKQPLEESLLDPATGGPRPPGPKHARMRI